MYPSLSVCCFLVMAAWLPATAVASSSSGGPADPAWTATQFQAGSITEVAPVFLRPDPTLTPLRELPVGTTVTIDQVRDEWVQVTFNDAQFGRRTGWVERRLVVLYAPEPPAEATIEMPADPGGRPAASQPPAPRRSNPIGIRGFGTFAYDGMAAKDSFQAIFGKSAVPSYGGGLQVTNLWRGLFLEVSVERSTLTGERVFVSEDVVYPLGIPLEVTMTPVEAVGGWRFGRTGKAIGYAGAGFTSMAYTETSDFAAPDENIDDRYPGWVVMGGIEFKLAAWVHLRGEARYRLVQDGLGAGGVSAAFGETKLGGFGGAVKIAVGR